MFRASRAILTGFLLVCLAAWSVMDTRSLRFASQAIHDLQAQWLREHRPTPLARDVVVIGLDEAAFESIPEPTALWHPHLGALLAGLSVAEPAVVGLAMPLPVRSYDFLVKDIDAVLLAGIYRLKSVAPLVVGQPPGIGGRLRPIAPELLMAIGEENVASLAICEDTDGVVRRINQRRCRNDDQRPPLALAVARHLGREGSLSGMIDYSVGGPIEYTPIGTVLDWVRTGQESRLRELVQGRAVVVASLLPNEVRYRLPVPLAGWEPGVRAEPGAVVHIQALRSVLGRGLIERAPPALSWLLVAVAVLFWFGRSGWLKGGLLVLLLGGFIVASGFALWHGRYLPVANAGAIALMAALARLGWDTLLGLRHKQMLRAMFAGHVSPKVMRALLGGELSLEQNGQRQAVTLMHVGIRGFTDRAAGATPEAVIGLLGRFHAVAAQAVQNHGGAVNAYVGDGLVATFGLPEPLPAPGRNALEAAQDLLIRVARLNEALAAEGVEPLRIGIGIHGGEVLAGYVGSPQRREFAVIGEAVGVAARLEALTKTHPHPVICSDPVAAAVDRAGGLAPLDARLDGLPLWGWTPPLDAGREAR